MTFQITAWGPDGRSVWKVKGPVSHGKLVGWDDEDVSRHGRRKYHKNSRKISSDLPTAGRASNTLGNLLHADLCADPGEARW